MFLCSFDYLNSFTNYLTVLDASSPLILSLAKLCKNVSGNQLLHDFISTTVNLLDSSISECTANGVLLHVSLMRHHHKRN